MKAFSAAGDLIGGRTRGRNRIMVGFTAAFTGVRVYRRLTRRSTKPMIRFRVKPGEVYEIRETSRGQ
ncbi:MAG: hypothetical protein JJE46_10250 [Acidimicrobiia bacterium]|nr:hypothetical protein [Acidimicrobiia bacterium]